MRILTIIGIFIFILGTTGCEKINSWASNIFPSKANSAKITESTPSSQQAKPEVKGTVLAKVNDHVITLEEFEENIKNLQALSEEIKLDTPEAKKELLTEMVNQELLYQEAKSRGIGNRDEVKKAVDNYMRGAMIQQLVLDATENVTIESQEIESFYNQYKDQFSEPEERKTREIVVGTEDEAKQILIGLLQGGDFASVAREKSISQSRSKGGDLGLIKKGDRGERFNKFDEIAFSLGQGEISNVFKCPDGYCIVKAEQIKEGKTKLLTEVWDPIKETLLSLKKQQKLEDLTEKLRQDAKIETSEDLLKYKK